MRSNPITVRLAVDTEASLIGDMVTKFYHTELPWEKVHPYWLVAEDRTGIVACVQVIVGQPFGVIEFLSFRENLSAVRKAYAVKKLSVAALAALTAAGCGGAFGMVPHGLESWRKVLKRKWNALMSRPCNVFWKALR